MLLIFFLTHTNLGYSCTVSTPKCLQIYVPSLGILMLSQLILYRMHYVFAFCLVQNIFLSLHKNFFILTVYADEICES